MSRGSAMAPSRFGSIPAVRFYRASSRGTDLSTRSAIQGAHVHVTGIITAIIIGLIIGALGRLVVPGKQNIPIWLTLVIGVVAALLGTLLAGALGVNDTKGIDWIELLLQVALAAVGVAIVAGTAGRRTR
jgi:uncharacterized membrane protein YeaQ/YmgE (transglycosylase-associated protein family)